MVTPSLIKGELPEPKEAYTRCLRLAWPSALESVLVALVSSVDTMMVGKLGPGAISAVGITTQPKFLLMAIIIALNMGVTAVVARRKGEGNVQGACRTLKQAVIICFGLAVVTCCAGFFLAEPLMKLAGAQADYIGDAADYFKIIMCGQVFNLLAMTINAAQRGFGNTKVSMRSNTAANLTNVLFNYLLINGIWIFPRMEVRGAALATALGSVVAFCMALASVIRDAPGTLSLVSPHAKWGFDKKTVSSISKVGSSALVEQVFMRIGFFVYGIMVANLGTLDYATHQICMQVLHVCFAFADGFAVAATSLVGQGLGAKRPDLSMLYGKLGQRCAMVIGIFLSIIFVVFRHQIVGFFTDDVEVIARGAQVMLILSATCLAQTSQVVISGCLRGAGDSKFVASTSFISIGILRPVLAWVLCYPMGWGLIGAWVSLFADQFLRLILNFTRFRGGKWTEIKI